jgi:hypothetical protein
MSRWPRGEAEIESLIAAKQLQQVIGGTSQRRTCATEGVAHRAPAGDIADRTPTAPKFLPMTRPGMPERRSLPTRGCAQRRQEATTSSRWLCVPSSATGSGPWEQCGDDATHSSTQVGPADHHLRRGAEAIHDGEALLLAAQQSLPTNSIFRLGRGGNCQKARWHGSL